MCDHGLSCDHISNFLLDGWPDATQLLQKKLKEKLLGKCKPKGPNIDNTDLTVRYIHEHHHYNYHESYEEACSVPSQKKTDKHECCMDDDCAPDHNCNHCSAPLSFLEKCKLWVWDPYLWQKVCH